MANANKQDLSLMNPRLNKDIASKLQSTINDIYKNTYYSDNKTNSYIDSIRRRMDNDINSLIDRTKTGNNGNNISNLFAKTFANSNDGLTENLRSALEDDSALSDIMDVYSKNAVIRDMDREIDVVCKYMSKLEEAIEIKCDHILSADHFNKDAIEITIATNNDKDSTSNSDNKFSPKKDLDAFKKKYKLSTKARKNLLKTCKYGENFTYIIPYNKALARLLSKNTNNANAGIIGENGAINEAAMNNIIEDNTKRLDFVYKTNTVLDESASSTFATQSSFTNDCYDLSDINNPVGLTELASNPESGFSKLDVEINCSGVLSSVVRQASSVRRVLGETTRLFPAKSVKTDDTLLSNANYIRNMNKQFSKFNKPNGSLETPTNLLTGDGFTDSNNVIGKNGSSNEMIDVPGAVVKVLDRAMVTPLYIDDTCLGYYYIETDKPLNNEEQTTFSSTLGGLRPKRSTRDRENVNSSSTNEVLKKIASQISSKIDAAFINANQDMAKEIYSILKYNSTHSGAQVGKIRVTFIPPEDIVHSYFDMDEKTHRGKSDLSKSLFPAKLFSCLYISNTIALLTRGYDKRIFHVKQSVDTNISQVLMNVIAQVRQSNFNLRQIENMNNILNVTGRFNDLVIPQNASGETPISFEVLPGQNVEVKTDFMNMLEEMAINLTGVSIEMVNSRRDEQTATHITMTNARFLMKIYARQQAYEEILSEYFTKIYQAEYDTNDVLEVKLPPPVMLNFTNTSQIIASANELITNIVQMEMGAEQDEEIRQGFTGKLMEYYYESFLPMDEIKRMVDETKIAVEAKRSSQGGDDMGSPQM